MKLTIISGGQTGADRGGFDAAIELGLDYTGWAPAVFRAEDGVIPDIYAAHMREGSSSSYGMRTRLNVQDSDATLIVSFERELTGGSAFTAQQCKAQRKNCQHLVLPAGRGRVPDEVRGSVLEWLRTHGVQRLNIAGPRESKEPGVQLAVKQALVWILSEVAAEELREFVGGGMRVLGELIDTEVAHAEKRNDAQDELMASAAVGGPFWGMGKLPVEPADLVGLGVTWTSDAGDGFPDTPNDRLADLAAKVARAGGQPDCVAIPPENVDLAKSAGLEVAWLPGERSRHRPDIGPDCIETKLRSWPLIEPPEGEPQA